MCSKLASMVLVVEVLAATGANLEVLRIKTNEKEAVRSMGRKDPTNFNAALWAGVIFVLCANTRVECTVMGTAPLSRRQYPHRASLLWVMVICPESQQVFEI